MRVFNLEATDMGNNQDEIAAKVMEYVKNKNFRCEDDFENCVDALIYRACSALGWNSVPQTGGLIAEWE